MIPAMGQAALGIECRMDSKVVEMLDFLNDKKACFETSAEREFVKTLEGGCQVPIGVNANLENNLLSIKAVLGIPDGTKCLRDSKEVQVQGVEECRQIGRKLALEMIDKGAREILQEAQQWEFNKN